MGPYLLALSDTLDSLGRHALVGCRWDFPYVVPQSSVDRLVELSNRQMLTGELVLLHNLHLSKVVVFEAIPLR